MADEVPREEKLEILSAAKIDMLDMERIEPDADGHWLNNEANDFKSLLPIASKEVKRGSATGALFSVFSLGLATNRDDWAYDVEKRNLSAKIRFFVETFNAERTRWAESDKKVKINDFVSRMIKWTSELEG